MNSKPEDDPALRSLLRGARPTPALPPRFHEGVWNRLRPRRSIADGLPMGWTEKFLMWVMQPRHVMVGAASLIAAGIALGIALGNHQGHVISKERYFAAVSPVTIR